MERHERVLKLGKRVSPARADHGSHQFDRGAGEGEVGLGRYRRPLRMVLPRTLVPFLVQIGEQAGTGVEPVYRARARRRHVDIEDPCERRLAGQKHQVRPARDPQYLLVAGLGLIGVAGYYELLRYGFHLDINDETQGRVISNGGTTGPTVQPTVPQNGGAGATTSPSGIGNTRRP